MKILMCGASGDRYGADGVLRHIASAFKSAGHEVHVYLPFDGRGAEALRSEDIDLSIGIDAALRRANLTPVGLLRFLARVPWAAVHAIRVVRRYRPDILWVNTVTLPVWVLVGRMMRIPVVCHSHETVVSEGLVRRLLFLVPSLSSKVVAVSNACSESLVTSAPWCRGRVVVKLNPSFDVREPVALASSAETDLVMLGRLSERKGQLVLLDAVKDLGRRGVSANVHIVGDAVSSHAGLQYSLALEKAASVLKNQVIFHGYVPGEIAFGYGGVVVVPSIEPESCPLVVAEALVAGRVVIASDCGGTAELLGGAGMLVPPGDSIALADAIEAVLQSAKLRHDLISRARTRSRDLDCERYLQEVIAMCEEIVDEDRRAAGSGGAMAAALSQFLGCKPFSTRGAKSKQCR